MKILFFVLLLAVVVNGILAEQPSNMSELVKFMCCKANSTTFDEVPLNDPTVLTKFDFTKKTHFYFHGWNNNLSKPWYGTYKRNWVNSGRDDNLCIVDWSVLSHFDYVTTVVKTQRDIGNYTAQVYLAWLHAEGLNYSDIILIGHSMGAQICGYIGNSLYGKIETIIGIDPAGPLFVGIPGFWRLSANDAKYVQNIHTSAIFGYFLPCGDADFYINSGILFQPHCPLLTFNDLFTIGCSHGRGPELFFDSLLYPNQYDCRGIRCSNRGSYLLKSCLPETVSLFGLDANQTLTGEFYASTNNSTTCTGDLYMNDIPITLF